jgi:Undecaprenyl-phosphate glucose phosphotransferase
MASPSSPTAGARSMSRVSKGLRTEGGPSVTDAPASVASMSARKGWPILLPFHMVEPAVFAVDLLLVVAISVLTGVGYHWIFLGELGSVETFLGMGVLVFANFSAISAARGSYRTKNLVNFRRQGREVSVIWTGVFLILLGIAFSLKVTETFSRGATLTFFAIGLSGIIAWRGLLARLLAEALAAGAFAERRIIIIGERGRLALSHNLLELRRCGYKPVSTFEIKETEIAAIGMPSTLRETLAAVIEAARGESIETIFLVIGWDHSRCIEGILNVLSVLPAPVHLLPDENVAHYLGRRTVQVGATWSAELKRAPLSKSEQSLKRSLDVLAAGTSLLLLAPLMLATALLVKLDSRGPVLFTQTRNGFNGRSFRIFKFRTMRVLEDGPLVRQATRNDPRVTRLGRWLRRTNIDELPQLFNVLRGEMSLVGPRPHAAAHNSEYEELISTYALRYHVKPGITGWAQLHGFRGETQTLDLMATRVEFDLWYINNWSFWLDVRILLKTLVLGIQENSAY